MEPDKIKQLYSMAQDYCEGSYHVPEGEPDRLDEYCRELYQEILNPVCRYDVGYAEDVLVRAFTQKFYTIGAAVNGRYVKWVGSLKEMMPTEYGWAEPKIQHHVWAHVARQIFLTLVVPDYIFYQRLNVTPDSLTRASILRTVLHHPGTLFPPGIKVMYLGNRRLYQDMVNHEEKDFDKALRYAGLDRHQELNFHPDRDTNFYDRMFAVRPEDIPRSGLVYKRMAELFMYFKTDFGKVDRETYAARKAAEYRSNHWDMQVAEFINANAEQNGMYKFAGKHTAVAPLINKSETRFKPDLYLSPIASEIFDDLLSKALAKRDMFTFSLYTAMLEPSEAWTIDEDVALLYPNISEETYMENWKDFANVVLNVAEHEPNGYYIRRKLFSLHVRIHFGKGNLWKLYESTNESPIEYMRKSLQHSIDGRSE